MGFNLLRVLSVASPFGGSFPLSKHCPPSVDRPSQYGIQGHVLVHVRDTERWSLEVHFLSGQLNVPRKSGDKKGKGKRA